MILNRRTDKHASLNLLPMLNNSQIQTFNPPKRDAFITSGGFYQTKMPPRNIGEAWGRIANAN